MFDALTSFFGEGPFLPHGHCYLWLPSLLWIQVISDALIAGSYFSIPVVLWYFVKKRPDFPFKWVMVMFGVFVMACGTTHVFAIINIWWPHYWAEAGVKIVTASMSVLTALMLWPLLPEALAIPSPNELRRINVSLQEEIARRRDAEANLRALNQALTERTLALEVANKELEAFSYSVSHDLRAPLRHIQGYARLLLAEVEGLKDSAKEYLSSMVQATTKMGSLVDDLLAFAKTSRATLNAEAVNLNAIVAAAKKECEVADAPHRIDWQLESLPIVKGDAKLLAVVFNNLISNAVKFTRNRASPMIKISATPSDDSEVVVCVKDNGAGFDQAYQHKLFGVFQRLHHEEEFEGNGIGLATVHRIVTRLGGRIWAEGVPGEGATFFVALKAD